MNGGVSGIAIILNYTCTLIKCGSSLLSTDATSKQHARSSGRLIWLAPKNKTEIESIISYGSSDRKNSVHYSDQMDMYSKFQTKKMTFDKKEIYKNAKKIYHPN